MCDVEINSKQDDVFSSFIYVVFFKVNHKTQSAFLQNIHWNSTFWIALKTRRPPPLLGDHGKASTHPLSLSDSSHWKHSFWWNIVHRRALVRKILHRINLKAIQPMPKNMSGQKYEQIPGKYIHISSYPYRNHLSPNVQLRRSHYSHFNICV